MSSEDLLNDVCIAMKAKNLIKLNELYEKNMVLLSKVSHVSATEIENNLSMFNSSVKRHFNMETYIPSLFKQKHVRDKYIALR